MNSDILGQQTQLWREEAIDGAVYITYLKRVPIQTRPWIWTENATHTLWDVYRVRYISAGTLQKLVDALAKQKGELDTSYANMFLSMFRTFATVEEVLSLILDRIKYWKSIERRNLLQATAYKQAYILALSIWLKKYPEDFQQAPDYTFLKRLILSTDEYAAGSHIKITAEALLQRFQAEDMQQQGKEIRCESVFSDDKMEYSMQILLNMSPTLIAEQLTYKDAELLIKLKPHHCLGCYWGNKKEPTDFLTVEATFNQYNDVSNIVISSVLKADPKPIHRAKVIEHWILVAQKLRKLNNFCSLHAVITALQVSSIFRLEKSWAVLSKSLSLHMDNFIIAPVSSHRSHKENLRTVHELRSTGKDPIVQVTDEYRELVHIFSVDNNMFTSRDVLMKEATSACYTTSKGKLVRKYPKEVTMQGTIPFLDLFLSDLIMLDSAIPSKTDAGLINFDKRRQEYDILAQLQFYQKSATLYIFKRNTFFWKWFHSVIVYSEADSHKLSWSLEP